MFCHLGHFFFFFLSWRVCYFKGRSLRCSPGRGNAGRSAVMHVGAGPRGSNGARFTLLRISILHSATHNQTGPLWCWFPSGWACARSRPLWVSPGASPWRLGVSPAAAPTPMGVFNQRFEALFPRAGTLGCMVCFAPRRCPVYLWANVVPRGATHHSACPVLCYSDSGPLSLSVCECRAAGSASGQTACPVRPTLRQSQSRHGHASPVCPGCPSPHLQPVWMNVYFLSTWCWTSLSFDFLSVLFVRGGAVCLPTPLSWFSQEEFFNVLLHSHR